VQTAAIPPISFPADAYEYVFRRGDASEVAEWALHYIEEGAGNVRCVYDKGAQWRYVPTRGVFVKIEPDDLYPLILSAAGMKVLSKMTAEGPKYVPLKLGSQHVTDAVRCMGMARFRRKFFSDNIPGIAFTDCFVRVTANGIEKHPHSPDWACNISYDFPWTDDPPVEWLTFLDEVWALHDVTDRGREVQSLGEWLGAQGLCPCTRKPFSCRAAAATARARRQSWWRAVSRRARSRTSPRSTLPANTTGRGWPRHG
jgi:hypothetical protein